MYSHVSLFKKITLLFKNYKMVKGKSTNSIFCSTTAFPPVDGVQVLRHSWAEWGGVTKDICLKIQQNRPYKGLNLALSILTPEC